MSRDVNSFGDVTFTETKLIEYLMACKLGFEK